MEDLKVGGAFLRAYERMLDCTRKRGLFDGQTAVCAMVSGGSDSTALAYLLATARDEGQIGALTFLHVNHKIRGDAAFEDARFVEHLADSLGVPLFLCEVDIPRLVQETGGNMEALARSERYTAAREALASMCEHEGFAACAGRIATAHTADDRIEAFYMRSIVGTGPGGFRAMHYSRSEIIRPLLDLTRQDLQDAICDLVAQGKALVLRQGDDESPSTKYWCEDATNADTDYFRAYVRHNIVPAAHKWNAGLATTLVRTMNLIADEDDMLEEFADEAVWEHVRPIEKISDDVDFSAGFLCLPGFSGVRVPIARRALHNLLKSMLGADARIDTAAVETILAAFDVQTGKPRGGYVANIQGNLAVSANKQGVRVEPMHTFRARRKKA